MCEICRNLNFTVLSLKVCLVWPVDKSFVLKPVTKSTCDFKQRRRKDVRTGPHSTHPNNNNDRRNTEDMQYPHSRLWTPALFLLSKKEQAIEKTRTLHSPPNRLWMQSSNRYSSLLLLLLLPLHCTRVPTTANPSVHRTPSSNVRHSKN